MADDSKNEIEWKISTAADLKGLKDSQAEMAGAEKKVEELGEAFTISAAEVQAFEDKVKSASSAAGGISGTGPKITGVDEGKEPTAAEDAINDMRLAELNAAKTTGSLTEAVTDRNKALASGVPDLEAEAAAIAATAAAAAPAVKATDELAKSKSELRQVAKGLRFEIPELGRAMLLLVSPFTLAAAGIGLAIKGIVDGIQSLRAAGENNTWTNPFAAGVKYVGENLNDAKNSAQLFNNQLEEIRRRANEAGEAVTRMNEAVRLSQRIADEHGNKHRQLEMAQVDDAEDRKAITHTAAVEARARIDAKYNTERINREVETNNQVLANLDAHLQSTEGRKKEAQETLAKREKQTEDQASKDSKLNPLTEAVGSKRRLNDLLAQRALVDQALGEAEEKRRRSQDDAIIKSDPNEPTVLNRRIKGLESREGPKDIYGAPTGEVEVAGQKHKIEGGKAYLDELIALEEKRVKQTTAAEQAHTRILKLQAQELANAREQVNSLDQLAAAERKRYADELAATVKKNEAAKEDLKTEGEILGVRTGTKSRKTIQEDVKEKEAALEHQMQSAKTPAEAQQAGQRLDFLKELEAFIQKRNQAGVLSRAAVHGSQTDQEAAVRMQQELPALAEHLQQSSMQASVATDRSMDYFTRQLRELFALQNSGVKAGFDRVNREIDALKASQRKTTSQIISGQNGR
jgi:hypothetical protein